jgi:hypothetical protein
MDVKTKRDFLNENNCEYVAGYGWCSVADGYGGTVSNPKEDGVFLGRNAKDAYDRFCDLNESENTY